MGIRLKLIFALLIALALMGAYAYGRVEQKAQCNAKELTAEIRGVREYEYMEREVRRLDESALDTVLDYWMQ